MQSSGKASMHRITRQSPLSTQSWPHHTLVRKAWGQWRQLQKSGRCLCAPLRAVPRLIRAECPRGPQCSEPRRTWWAAQAEPVFRG